jgi:hypothetical protein
VLGDEGVASGIGGSAAGNLLLFVALSNPSNFVATEARC